MGCPPHHWGELEIAREQLTDELLAAGAAPHSIPIGGSTPTGALGYLAAYVELVQQCRDRGLAPAAVVHASSSGGTHAGLVAGRLTRGLMASNGTSPNVPTSDFTRAAPCRARMTGADVA